MITRLEQGSNLIILICVFFLVHHKAESSPCPALAPVAVLPLDGHSLSLPKFLGAIAVAFKDPVQSNECLKRREIEGKG